MPAFLGFGEFSDAIQHGAGMQLFVLTRECDDDAKQLGERLRLDIGPTISVHNMCADAYTSPSLVFYAGGDLRPLITLRGELSSLTIADALSEAMHLASTRQSKIPDVPLNADEVAQTEQMLATEQLDQFPPFFQMARGLARDAWRASVAAAHGAPLLLSSDAAAARFEVCASCPSLRDDRCVECGCFMNIKAHLASMECPLKKWPRTNAAFNPT